MGQDIAPGTSLNAQPQDTARSPRTVPEPMPSADAQPEDYALRYELAQRVEEMRPMEERVEEILGVLAQELNEEDRQRFVDDVTANLNMERLEGLAVGTMAQLYTPGELQSMIDFYRMPESRSIAEKSPIYRQIVDSEISREIQLSLNQLASTPPEPDVAEPPAQIIEPVLPDAEIGTQ